MSTLKNRPADFSAPATTIASSMSVRRPVKTPPARMDFGLSNRPSAQPTPGIFNGSQYTSGRVSPTTSEASHRSRRMLTRNATSPAPFRPPSSDIPLPQDCAFPPFPTAKSRSATPTTPSESKQFFREDTMPADRRLEANGGKNPPSPRAKGSDLLQRMNSIAPGPFNMNRDEAPRLPGHQRTASGTSKTSAARSSTSSSASYRSRQASISATSRSRHPSLSSIAGGPRSLVFRDMADSPTLPTIPSSTQDSTQSSEPANADKWSRPIETLQHSSRSHTYPLQQRQEQDGKADFRKPTRRPSEPAVAAIMKPLDEIGSTSTFKSSRSLKGRKPVPGNDSAGVSDTSTSSTRLENAPPMPKARSARNLSNTYPYHTPTESVSSNESSGSDTRSVSSRSTPPLSGSPSKRRPSHNGQAENLFQGFQFGIEQVPIIEEPVPPQRATSATVEKPMSLSQPAWPSRIQDSQHLVPDSPTDPAIHRGRPPLAHVPSDYNAPTVPLQNGHLRLSPAPPPEPEVQILPKRKPTTANKGKCRGCNELIKGKSVSSADGRLTGRYHRSCFTCKTCKEPFQTADFYVHDNHPFCARHYHELNGSLCKACDRGIEGQYLETELKQKFHPYCFTCQDCHRILRDDYFEMGGKTYCEQHALGISQQQTSLLGPGRRHPERRTTRLMMM
ncbi:MAG: hypothetical protein Q9174_001651 [Haloplaca sp. 1 TL-2023]